MLRWALQAKKDIRCSMPYFTSNVPTVQVLAIKRMIRYLENLEQHQRFVSAVREDTLQATRKRVGPNIFHYMEDVMSENFAELDV